MIWMDFRGVLGRRGEEWIFKKAIICYTCSQIDFVPQPNPSIPLYHGFYISFFWDILFNEKIRMIN